jgi:group I intron endonuclease
MQAHCLIYKITCLVGQKVYIGQTALALDRRWKKHLSDTRQRDCAIHRAIRKYGPNNFRIEVLERCAPADADSREQFWIAACNSTDPKLGYNRTVGGQFGKLTSESRVRLSESKTGAQNWMYGKSHSPATRAQMSRTRKGRPAHNRAKSWPRKDGRYLTVMGRTLSLAEWSRRSGLPLSALYSRVYAGWSDDDVLSRPLRRAKR